MGNLTPWLFLPPVNVIAIVTRDGVRIGVQPGSWSQFLSPTGELWCSWVSSTDGQTLVRPRHRITRLIYDNDSEHEDMGFA